MILELTSAVHEYKLSMGDYSVPIQKVIEYIDFHLSEEIHIEDLSRTANVSTSHLSKIFKRETDKTITEYIAEKRWSIFFNNTKRKIKSPKMIIRVRFPIEPK